MLNYPQSLISDQSNCIYVAEVETDKYYFNSLDKALTAVRDCYKSYRYLTFKISSQKIFDDDDSITFSESINYEF